MWRYDPRLIIGSLLVLGGVLSLLDALGIIADAGNIFWGLVWGAVGVGFLYVLLQDRARNWWAAFPAFTLIGISASLLLPNSLEAFDGLVFFAGISLAFWWVYFTATTRWWAIIPAGVMLTLGITSLADELTQMETGGIFFLGLGLTFVLVAILPGGRSRSWAWIPGVALLLFGLFSSAPLARFTDYLMPVILILLGVLFVLRFFTERTAE
ncbi:MAG TPA: hypothetical protein VNK49_02440 [Anaerolineales bacterium]|nr:hypothetical protein [Anaerolineales bacterium]